MSIDYAQAFKDSRDRMPFSNGTEGYEWQANWCDRCARDAPFRNDISLAGCPLLLVAMLGHTPAQWLEQPLSPEGLTTLGDQYHCIEFRAQGGRGDGEPKPQPDLPGQGTLLPREPLTGVRMYVQPEPQRVEGTFQEVNRCAG